MNHRFSIGCLTVVLGPLGCGAQVDDGDAAEERPVASSAAANPAPADDSPDVDESPVAQSLGPGPNAVGDASEPPEVSAPIPSAPAPVPIPAVSPCGASGF